MISFFVCVAVAIVWFIVGWACCSVAIGKKYEGLQHSLDLAIDDRDDAVLTKIAAYRELEDVKNDLYRLNAVSKEEHTAHQDHLEAIQDVMDYFYDTVSKMLEVNDNGGDGNEAEAKVS